MQSLRSKPLILGLPLGSPSSGLLHTASSLARQLGSSLELVHAVRPIFDYVGAGDIVVNPYYGYDAVLSDIEVAEAQKNLDKLKAELPKDLVVRTHVVRDYAPEALRTLAQELQAGLILCGIQKGQERSYLKGTTTGFALAGDSEIPVLIIPDGSSFNFSHPTRVLIADNLGREGQEALDFAILFSDEIKAKELCHAYVHKQSRIDFEHLADTVRTAMTLGKIPDNPEFTADSYQQGLREKLRAELSLRFQNAHGSAKTRSHYTNEVAFGTPSEEMHKLAVQREIQVMVFGRHHLLHRHAYIFGNISYEEMIESGIATLIVPDSHPGALPAASKRT